MLPHSQGKWTQLSSSCLTVKAVGGHSYIPFALQLSYKVGVPQRQGSRLKVMCYSMPEHAYSPEKTSKQTNKQTKTDTNLHHHDYAPSNRPTRSGCSIHVEENEPGLLQVRYDKVKLCCAYNSSRKMLVKVNEQREYVLLTH